MKVLRPPFAYYGGKTRMAKDIINLIPEGMNTYAEPFAGGLSVLLCKEPHNLEVINDLDGRIVDFWKTLREQPEELRLALELTPYSRQEFEHALKTVDDEQSSVERARKIFVILRQSRRRTTTGAPGNFRATGHGKSGPSLAFVNSLKEFAPLADRLRKVVIERTDALELIPRWDKHDTVMYLDPPYVGETRTARDYAVENAGVEFHERLVSLIESASARVILSGYDHPVYSRLSGWRRADSYRNTGSTSASSRYAVETIWTNF